MIEPSHRPARSGPAVDHEVIIVGGGVVGLSMALFLQRHGVQPLLVERHSGTSIHPRSRGVNARIMELYRAVGLEERVREAGRATPIALGMLRGETLAEAIASPASLLVRRAIGWVARRGVFEPRFSPASACRVTQDHLEPVLADAARTRGAELRFGTELVACVQDGDAVEVELRHRATGAAERLRCRWLVAADGARSPMRERLGVPCSGRGSLGHLLNVLFDADLEGFVRGREFSLAVVHHPEVRGLFATIDNRRRWVFHIAYDRNRESPSDYPPERCARLVQTALGAGSLPIRIESVLPWECAARVADRYRVGRIFLVGDAAHLMPPWGGMGANTGIADAWDLAWKLAMVVRGADQAVLDTYEAERRPVAVLATERSADNADPTGLMAPFSARRMFMGPRAAPGAPGKLDALAGFGWQYRSALVASEVGGERFRLDGRPGTRLPHLWLMRHGQRVSSLDLVGTRWTALLAARAVPPVVLRGDVEVLRAGVDFADPERALQRAAKLSPHGALLVRPDSVVAWRGADTALPAAVETLLSWFPMHTAA